MALRVYLDTSVFSARYDERARGRMRLTEEFFARLGEFEAVTTSVTKTELEATQDVELRERLLETLEMVEAREITLEMRTLAQRYVDEDVFAAKVFNDALHVAAAVLLRQDVLVSWNFRHLVNRRRRARINALNCSWGLPTIEIIAPPEV